MAMTIINNFPVIMAVLTLISLVLIVTYFLKQQSLKRERYLKNYEFPLGFDEKILNYYPFLSLYDLELVKKTLLQFFRISNNFDFSDIVMPSRVVDVAWHEFILFTKDYHLFCKQSFGYYIHHQPFIATLMLEKIENKFQYTWKLACDDDDIDPKDARRLPLLFSIDIMLSIPDANDFTPILISKIRTLAEQSQCSGAAGCGGCGGCGGC